MKVKYGAPTTSDIQAITNFVVMIFLIVFNCGPFVFREHHQFIGKLEKLREAAEALAA